MAPFFSLILPVYNVKSYIERCVQSILTQSFADYEIILVDDGSTDGSGALCDSLAGDKISVIHKENGGLASARNAGLKQAAGEYIWFIDSDDWIEPEALAQLHTLTAAAQPEMVKFDYIRVEQTAAEVHSNAKPGLYRGEALETLRDLAFYSAGKYVLSACTHIYSRKFLTENKAAFVSERLTGSEDYLFNLELLAVAELMLVTDKVFYNYEQRQGSLTQRYKEKLPQRYETLHTLLTESYRRLGVLSMYESRLSGFYIWHLLRGTCIPNAYYVAQGHTLREGRKEIREFLGSESFRQAYKRIDKKAFSPKKRLYLTAMKWRLEPLFYWLYVTKPGLKKGKKI